MSFLCRDVVTKEKRRSDLQWITSMPTAISRMPTSGRISFKSAEGTSTSACDTVSQLYNSRMRMLQAALLALAVATLAPAQQSISFPSEDGGRVCADLYGEGVRAIVLAHGGRFSKESWRVQANALVSAGFLVLTIDFRGFDCSTGPGQADFDSAPFWKDVLAAVHYLKAHGAKAVSVVGGSFSGSAAGDASINSAPGEIDRIVFLGAAPNLPAEKLKSRALFIVARDVRLATEIRRQDVWTEGRCGPRLYKPDHALSRVTSNPAGPAERFSIHLLSESFIYIPEILWAVPIFETNKIKTVITTLVLYHFRWPVLEWSGRV
jgi:pimeloyl-ACP methyl ester carboxylesterase